MLLTYFYLYTQLHSYMLRSPCILCMCAGKRPVRPHWTAGQGFGFSLSGLFENFRCTLTCLHAFLQVSVHVFMHVQRYLCGQRLGLPLFRFCLFPCLCVPYGIIIHLSQQRYKEGGDPVVLLEPLKVRKGGLIARSGDD
jgi:hypothetical protein